MMLSCLPGAQDRKGLRARKAPMSTDLCFSTAVELARRIRTREVSVTEVVQAHLAQIERVNPKVNAVVTLTADRALAEAREKDAALACGMVPIADGSDTGGSLRNPASFCNVVGLRGAVGRVPPWPTDAPWGTLHVPGPMARTVSDVALMLSVMAGPDPRSPVAIAQSGDCFRGELGRDFKGVRIGWSRDLGGLP